MDINRIKCDYCHEEIDVKSRRCPYCGSLQNIEKRKSNVFFDVDVNTGSNTNLDLGIDEDANAGTNLNTNTGTDANTDVVADTTHMVEDDFYNPGIVPRRNTLSNNMKVFLTVITSLVPGLGQIVGIIIAIIFMNSENDLDKRSFGVALLVSSIIIFALTFLWFFIIVLAAGKMYEQFYFSY